MKKITQRDSNIELLRIIAMLMVLILHADFQALGQPSAVDIASKPASSAIRVLLEMMSLGAVNIFVLISGWFTIKPSVKGFISFIFQWVFFSVGIYAVSVLLGSTQITLKEFARCFSLISADTYWFIPSYMCLYLFAPVLNTFISNTSKREHLIVIMCFFIYQTIYSFVGAGASFLMKGYSALSFMGLYLLASYVRRYYRIEIVSKQLYLYCYFALSVVLTLVFLIGVLLGYDSIASRMTCYSNPLLILASLSLLLFFVKISFKSNCINWISKSCFAVYLLHSSPFLYYNAYLRSISIYQGYPFRIIYVVLLWFIVAILVDKVRLKVWDSLSSKLFNENSSIHRLIKYKG